MIPLKPTQKAVLGVLKRWWQEYKVIPLANEIAVELGMPYSTVHHTLISLDKLDYIEFVDTGHKRRPFRALRWE